MERTEMSYIRGVSFGYMAQGGKYADEGAQSSMKSMVEETNANTVVLAVNAYQQTAHSDEIFFKGNPTPTDAEIRKIAEYARSLGLKIILKPMVSCIDGERRAYINFLDIEAPCESKWSKWFEEYSRFILHYAQLAEEIKCEMFVIGSELVCAERKEQEWRTLIAKVRKEYSGLITYNADKYQEDNVAWWDAVDIISSSAFYPIDAWDKELIRIGKIAEKYQKPVFFIALGCMSNKGSSLEPGNWQINENLDLEEQVNYFTTLFEKCRQYPWLIGLAIWHWKAQLYRKELGKKNVGYDIYGKPVCKVIKEFYTSID